MELRDYQLRAIDAVRARFSAGDRSTLLVLATGLGKTVIFSEIARRAVTRGNRVLVLAHREELLDQAAAKLAAIGVEAGIEQAGRRAGTAPVVVASVATLRGDRLASWAPDAFALIVVDECQHAPAASYQAILEHFTGARVLGVTATPDRGDGTPLGETFQSVAYRYEIRDAIRDGWLAPITARRIVIDGIDLSEIKTRAGDLAQNQLADVMEDARAVAAVVAPVLEHAGSRSTIVFAASVAHAHAIAAGINVARPGQATVVWGDMDRDARKAALAAYGSGAIQYAITVDVLTEGYDAPRTSCVVIARPTKSRARYVQAVGRGTRLFDGKADCLILDVTGQAGRHRLIGPADCLAGDGLPDDVRAELDALLGTTSGDLERAIDVAEAAAKQARLDAARAAVIAYHTEHLDPFLGAQQTFRADASGELATVSQLAQLDKQGAKKLPATLSKVDAQRILERLDARKRGGLCRLGQARHLARAGIDPRAVTFERATALITKLKAGDWRPWTLANEPEAVAGRERAAAKAATNTNTNTETSAASAEARKAS